MIEKAVQVRHDLATEPPQKLIYAQNLNVRFFFYFYITSLIDEGVELFNNLVKRVCIW